MIAACTSFRARGKLQVPGLQRIKSRTGPALKHFPQALLHCNVAGHPSVSGTGLDEIYTRKHAVKGHSLQNELFYSPDQGSLASAMTEAYKRVEASINQGVASKT